MGIMLPIWRQDKPFKPIDPSILENDPSINDQKRATDLLDLANGYRNENKKTEADRIYALALRYANKALNVRGLVARKRTEIQALIKEINESKDPTDAKRAVGLCTNAGLNANRGYFADAKELYDLALFYAEKSKDQVTISQVRLAMGQFYYYWTGNTGKAIDFFDKVLKNPGTAEGNAVNAAKDMRDIESFKFSQISVSETYRHDSSGARAETVVNGNFSLNSLSPSTYGGIGGIDVGVTYKGTNFLGTRDITTPFVTPASIAADPLMPDYLKRLNNIQYPILEINGVNAIDLKLNYSLPMFNGLFTAPSRVMPVVNVGYGITYTSVNATTYRNYRYLDSKGDYQGQLKEQQLRTIKHTVPISAEIFKFTSVSDTYAKTWYFTPYAGTSMSILSANAKSVYSFMDNMDHGKPSNVWSRNWQYGIRISMPRYSGLPFFSEIKDDAGRYNINLRYQIDRDSTVNSENGIWTVNNPTTPWPAGDTTYAHQPRVCSLHFGIDREFDLLGGTANEKKDCDDKTPLKSVIPVSIQTGLADLGAMNNKKVTGYYIGASIGYMRNNWGIKLGCSYSTNGYPASSTQGKRFNSTSLSLALEKRF